jgi:hypothetical protein
MGVPRGEMDVFVSDNHMGRSPYINCRDMAFIVLGGSWCGGLCVEEI